MESLTGNLNQELGRTRYRLEVLNTHPDSPVNNRQIPGIGCLAVVDGLLVINNLGRNVEVCLLQGGQLKQVALFAETVFSNQEVSASEFDLDMHAMVLGPSGRQLVLLNHYGLTRALPWNPKSWQNAKRPEDLATELIFKWPGDIERIIIARDRLVGTSPIGYAVEDPPLTGLMVSDGWDDLTSDQSSACVSHKDFVLSEACHRMRYHQIFPEIGITTALGLSPSTTGLCIAAGRKVMMMDISDDWLYSGQFKQRCAWEAELEFAGSWINMTNNNELLVAGPEAIPSGPELADWMRVTGGGWARLNARSGEVIQTHKFDCDLAWGNGSSPVLEHNGEITGVDRFGNVHTWDVATGELLDLSKSGFSDSLGIAKLVAYDEDLICGFNRGGYSVYRYVRS